MRYTVIVLLILAGACRQSLAQSYTPVIETHACMTKVHPSLIAKCGYLVVPENRQKPGGRSVKIPFVYVRKPGQDSTRNITLYTTGGPGYSTIANIDSIGPSSGFLQFGGFILFDQRGTKNAQPCLDCPEITPAIQQAYRKKLPKDRLELEAVKQCRQRLTAQGIDLSAYNTIESAEDINDLRLTLKIDSLTLLGISYSGGLMLTVARNHPEAVKGLILNSPLPSYVNYEEHALFNQNEALEQVFRNCETDSAHTPMYAHLRERFQQYFTSITAKHFSLPYIEKGKQDTLHIEYTKQELLDAIINRINTAQLKSVPFVIHELISENHAVYIKEVLDDIFAGNKRLSHGMRYSVYCAEQIAYADKALVKKQETIMPWFAGYAFNNVNHAICKCWEVKPGPTIAKTPVYSTIPALIAAGDADPWCRPFYNRLIKRTMPNSQLLIVHDNGHGARLKVDGIDFVEIFLNNPYKKIISPTKNVTIE